ncbi:major facilitator superfamily domain-containing protein 7 [Seriola lalandi dorsalis]|uniref:Solute carrier family 49 member 3 n=1 Tax=Seriola lalandi dorsalis TaxID=1841481 RepID=A0A3B4Z044_SERLL|nr:major facilitator superfamily domain-containing protein 7 [Seriola lalandi dorsalis]
MENGGEVSSEVQTVSSDEPRRPNPELRKLLVFKVYNRRWFVLLVLCLLNCSNATIWLTFAPIADQSAQYLKVSLEEVNWLSVIYMVVAIPVSFGTTWMLDTLGLRVTLILGSGLNMFGALLRFLGTPRGTAAEVRYVLVMLGQTLGALAQPLIIFTPTKLAALWFPDHQRATANTIASMSNPLGVLLANIISPLMVPTSAQIPVLLLAYAIPACIICFLATVGIRSSTPPTPPSASAESSSCEPFIQGIKLLLKNKAYLILLLCFGSGIAVFTCFSTLLEQILCVQGYTNDFAGLCGALFIVFGIVGAGALGLYVDKTKKFIEATKINMSFSALACIAFSVVSLMPQQKAAVAAACSLFGLFGFSIYPVAMELSVECSYPVGEATSAGLIFVSGQVQSVLYIIILQALTKRLADAPLSTCGDANLSWRVPTLVMAGLCSVFTCCFIIFFHTRYRRLEAEEEAMYVTPQINDSATDEDAPSVDT